MGKSKSTQDDGMKPPKKTQELERTKNLPQGFYKDGVQGSK